MESGSPSRLTKQVPVADEASASPSHLVGQDTLCLLQGMTQAAWMNGDKAGFEYSKKGIIWQSFK